MNPTTSNRLTRKEQGKGIGIADKIAAIPNGVNYKLY